MSDENGDVVSEPSRKLATIEVVRDVRPIPGADAIEVVTVRGWNAVCKRGEFVAGDLGVYFEIDSFLPIADVRFAFLAPRGTKEVDGVTGHVLRTAKLRGQVSQGLLLPLSAFSELAGRTAGEDVTEELGIVKWEAPILASMRGLIRGNFPTQFAPKTDAERVQNLGGVYDQLLRYRWVATEKIDGTSTTYIRDEGKLRVCSRNLEFAEGDTTPWLIARRLKILDSLEDGDALQGELFGEGIQGNPLKMKGHHFLAFMLWRRRKVVPLSAWPDALKEIAVPSWEHRAFPVSVEAAIEQTDGVLSSVNPAVLAEGVVWHTTNGECLPELDGRPCFKVISNKWLLKSGT